jgi:hypothetical protein
VLKLRERDKPAQSADPFADDDDSLPF